MTYLNKSFESVAKGKCNLFTTSISSSDYLELNCKKEIGGIFPAQKSVKEEHRGTWKENNSDKKSLFFTFYQILKLVLWLLMMIWKVKQPISLVFTPIQFPDQKS